MLTRSRALVVTALTMLVMSLVVGGAGGSTASPSPSPSTPAAPDTKLLLILDGSRSMRGADPSGGTRIEAAKGALTSVVDSLPDSAQVGLRVFGATASAKDSAADKCTDTQLVVPVGTLDKDAMATAIDDVTGQAATPIAHALEEGLKDLGDDGKRNIVLVSDGVSNCDPPPCPTIEKLIGQGVDIQIDTVGYGLDPSTDEGKEARDELECIAAKGNGTFYDAGDADALKASLVRAALRALRPYAFSGTPVTGNVNHTQAPTLDAQTGQYLDSMPVEPQPRWYRVTRTPGSIVRFSVNARPGPSDEGNYFEIALETEGGEECDTARLAPEGMGYLHDFGVVGLSVMTDLPDPEQVASSSSRSSSSASSSASSSSSSRASAEASASSAGTTLPPETPSSTSSPTTTADPCADDPVLLARVQRTEGSEGPTKVEIGVLEEAPVQDGQLLPPTTDEDAPALVPDTSPEQQVVGGTSFSDALEVTPGTYLDEVMPGEQVFYKIRTDFGQQPVLTLDAPAPGQSLHDPEVSTAVEIKAFSPDRQWLTLFGTGDHPIHERISSSNPRAVLHRWAPTVQYRNHWGFGRSGHMDHGVIKHASVAGYYYFSVSAGVDEDEKGLQGPVPVRLRFGLNGQPGGQPAYVGPDGEEGGGGSDDAKGTDGSGVPWLAVGAGGLVVLGALGAAAAVAMTRRQSTRQK